MAKSKILSTMLVASAAFTAVNAQVALTHDNHIKREFSVVQKLQNWQVGQAPSDFEEDEYFFVSRVKMMKRFDNTATQVIPDLTPKRRVLFWMPIGDGPWKSMPRYMYNSDVFSMWNYIDIHGNWSESVSNLSLPAAFADVAHKNGVATAVVSSPGYGATIKTTSDHGAEYQAWSNAGAEKMLALMHYYGIDGIGFNSEGNFVNVKDLLQNFFENMHMNKSKYQMEALHFDWYDGENNSGYNRFSEMLCSENNTWFHGNNDYRANGFFLNYNWTDEGLRISEETAASQSKNKEGASWNVYAGQDWQGRSGAGNGGNTGQGWLNLADRNISVGLWGAHSANMPYGGAYDHGATPDSVMQRYQAKLEHMFTGSTKNIATAPRLQAKYSYSGDEKDTWSGVAKLITARSVLSWKENGYFPFVTYFSMGNGKKLYREGAVDNDQEWYNIGMQDYLPTWRYWVTTNFMGRPTLGSGTTMKSKLQNTNPAAAPSKIGIKPYWDDAWMGGSSLRIFSAANAAQTFYLQLFKTQFQIEAGATYKLGIRYKELKGAAPTLAWAVSTEDEPTVEKSRDIKSTTESNGWKYSEISIKTGLGGWVLSGKTIALLGLKFTNFQPGSEILIGEISLIKDGNLNPSTPVLKKPTSTFSNIQKTTYFGVDFKLIWDCQRVNNNYTKSTGSKAVDPIYNADCDIWYFEVFSQEFGQDSVHITNTTSWAAYGIEAPYDVMKSDNKIRFGVRAVAPDGKTKTKVVWTEYMQPNKITPVHTMVVDKPVIKPGEEFTLFFKDPTHANVVKIDILSPDGSVVKTTLNAKQFKTSISEVGIYDVRVTVSGTENVTFSSLVQISQEGVGAVPKIKELKVVTTPDSQETVGGEKKLHFKKLSDVTYSYTAGRTYDNGSSSGASSRAIELGDRNAIAIDGAYMPYDQPITIAFWMKIKSFEGQDNFSLISLRTRNNGKTTVGTDGWQYPKWGAMWSSISKEGKMSISWRFEATGGSTDGADNSSVTAEKGAPLGDWIHVAIAFDPATNNGNKGRQAIFYVNGVKTGEDNAARKNFISRGTAAFISHRLYIGGPGNLLGLPFFVDDIQIWHKKLNQNEVKTAMLGYIGKENTIPAELKGYWTFENMNEDMTFPNVSPHKYTPTTYIGNSPIETCGNRALETTVRMVDIDMSDKSEWSPNNNNKVKSSTGNFPADSICPPLVVPGCPLLSGSLPIQTVGKWVLDGADKQPADGGATSGTATVKYPTDGEYTAKVILKNEWAADSLELKYIVIDADPEPENPTALENVSAQTSVYPNPFVEQVNMRFTDGGDYTVDVLDLSGRLVLSQTENISAGELVQVRMGGFETGVYIFRVKTADGKIVKTIKVEKK